MRLQLIAGALALVGSSAAFSDSHPLVLVSTSTFADAPAAAGIQTSSQAIQYTKEILSSCPTDRYLLVSQPGVHTSDLRGPDSKLVHLRKAIEDKSIRGKYIVPEVVGDISNDDLAGFIRTACAKKNKQAQVDDLALSQVSSSRAHSLSKSDDRLARDLASLYSGASNSYTILYVGTTGEPTYQPEFDEPVRMDLKRSIQSSSVKQRDEEDEWKKLPLFEKYQFFTPGIFMAIITAIVLLSILFIGLKALGSLEVSYGAFDKDMGPSAQKKQQ